MCVYWVIISSPVVIIIVFVNGFLEILRPGKKYFFMKSRGYGHSMTKINTNFGGLLPYFNADSWGGGVRSDL